MNRIIENNSFRAILSNFINRYKKILFTSIIVLCWIIIFILFNYFYNKTQNEDAAKIYSQWTKQIQESETNALVLYEDLTSTYIKTGYAHLALLNYASLEAKKGNNQNALDEFLLLVEATNGFRGNDLLNKLARINSARLFLEQGDLDDALKMIKKYIDSPSNALIHELAGDIFFKKKEFDNAKQQYIIAKEEYSNETSKLIIDMKIANLEI